MKSRFFGTAVVGLVGAIVGSFSMMLFASTHFANIAGPNNTPPAASAAPLTVTGTSDQDRIVNAVKHVQPAVVATEHEERARGHERSHERADDAADERAGAQRETACGEIGGEPAGGAGE